MPGSSFATAQDLTTLGAAAVTVVGQTDVQPYGLTLPGADTDPGHRQIPGQSHLAQGADSIDGLTTVYYDFRIDYGVDPVGSALTNQISTAQQQQRVREIFDIYSHYLGVQFVETTPGIGVASPRRSITIATGLLSAVNPSLVSGVGGALAVSACPTGRSSAAIPCRCSPRG